MSLQNDHRSAPTMLSSDAANTSDSPVVDPVTDALAAAIYHVMEQLGQMVGLLFYSFSSRLQQLMVFSVE